MLQSVLFVVALFIGHRILIRRTLRWLPAARRICAKITIQLIGILVSIFILIANALVVPFLVIDGFILAFVSIINMVLYIHFAFYIIQKRLKWTLEERPFGIHDWLLPGSVLFSLILCVVSMGASVYWVVDWMDHLQVPGVEHIADWLEPVGD